MPRKFGWIALTPRTEISVRRSPRPSQDPHATVALGVSAQQRGERPPDGDAESRALVGLGLHHGLPAVARGHAGIEARDRRSPAPRAGPRRGSRPGSIPRAGSMRARTGPGPFSANAAIARPRSSSRSATAPAARSAARPARAPRSSSPGTAASQTPLRLVEGPAASSPRRSSARRSRRDRRRSRNRARRRPRPPHRRPRPPPGSAA